MRITDDILIKFLLNESTAEENTAVREWLDADAANRKQYAQIESIWSSSQKLATNSTTDEQQAWIRFKERIQELPVTSSEEAQPQSSALIRTLNPAFRWMRIAAILVLIAGLVFINKYVGKSRYTDIVAYQTVLTKILPDGSEITLNKYCNLSYADNFTENRSIRLQQGEAFFKVAADKQHPFVIEAGGISVMVVGTSFNVKHLNDTTEVIVETGIVKVSRGKDLVELRKGEKVLILPSAGKLHKQQNTDQLYNFYQSKVLVAVNTPIAKITETLNKTYGTNIGFKDAEIGRLTITTTFKEQSVDQIIEIICQTLDLKAEHNHNQILLSKLP